MKKLISILTLLLASSTIAAQHYIFVIENKVDANEQMSDDGGPGQQFFYSYNL
jgi:hypothetical protein